MGHYSLDMLEFEMVKTHLSGNIEQEVGGKKKIQSGLAVIIV